ncbi:MAG: FAD-dependent thymidylate synthase [Holosporaceae bacterium]|jgi:thymidylate synthase (FAD)|nr:FAD-dependent thymidylate synthase [Holosporaceae bacterium]
MHDLPPELSEAEINKIREEFQTKTVRATSPEMEEILYKPFRVLDHGFVRVVDYMGTDASIVQAARVSYGAGTKKTSEDRGLINYLMRHQHTTPFEMCEIKLHIKMPIFVARQWMRHRTASMNEYSARYSVLSNEFYIPEASQLATQSEINKQGKSSEEFTPERTAEILEILKQSGSDAYEKYSHMINDLSLARELARTILPLSIYTETYWKIDLHNLLHFLRLRADIHAQYEIRCYAEVILEILKKWVPFTYEAFTNYKKDAVPVPKKCVELLKRAVNGEKISEKDSGLSKGEWLEFTSTFNLKD